MFEQARGSSLETAKKMAYEEVERTLRRTPLVVRRSSLWAQAIEEGYSITQLGADFRRALAPRPLWFLKHTTTIAVLASTFESQAVCRSSAAERKMLQLRVEVGSWATESEQREHGNALVREDPR